MLKIIRSNRVETLLSELSQRLRAEPLCSPFDPECVVVPSPAMSRWVNLRLAEGQGIAANMEYPLPSTFVWDLSRTLLDDLPEQDPLERDVLTWKVFGVLPELLGESPFASLRRYLGEDLKGLKRLQLASRIADVFDRYQLYRPELIRDWDAGRDEDWQALLWRRLTLDTRYGHRVAANDRLLKTLDQTDAARALPERVSLFAISSLPPSLVAVFLALARHTVIDLYLHAPTDAFWADLVSQKALARKRLDRPDEADLWEVGNSLLASWGRQGQALQDLLLDDDAPMMDVDAFSEPFADTLLEHLQRDIYRLRSTTTGPGEREAVEADGSVRIHVCHSALRECQVLHDELLGMLASDPDLRPEDILVMVPEISAYAPYIEAVFQKDDLGSRPFIPWNLSDISVREEHPLVRVFLQLLALPESRFSRSEVLSYLDVPELAAQFGLDAEAVLRVRGWLASANLRWGLDGNHKRRLGLPGVDANTWVQAEDRLFGGYALGESGLFRGIAPIGAVQGKEAETLGRFWHLLSRLTETAEQMAIPRTAREWALYIGELLAALFGERAEADSRLQKIRDELAELAEHARGVEEQLAPELIRRWLEQRLSSEGRHGRYFSGGVTFCGMRPMRSVPFEVICVMGLQDGAFPRQDRLSEFDRMRDAWKPGDPRKGDEDRYLFLETLLCARRRFYLSYVGRDIRTDSERQPSMLVRELLDYIDQQYRSASGSDAEKFTEALIGRHPLQPFSPRNYLPENRSHDQYWCEVANLPGRSVAIESEAESTWNFVRLAEPPEGMREVGLEQLDRFLRHPPKFFVNNRLGLYLREEEPEEDEEFFDLDGLQRFHLGERMLEARLAGQALSRSQLMAEGELPHGAFAELSFAEEGKTVSSLVESLTPYVGVTPVQVPLDLRLRGDLGPRALSGQIGGIYPDFGLMRWRPAKMKGAEVVSLWLAHLAWCATGEAGDKRSVLYSKDKAFEIAETLSPGEACSRLERYLGWYWEGLHRPLLVLPKASFDYAEQRRRGGRGNPMNPARNAWRGNSYQDIPGDRDDSYVQLVCRGVSGDPLEHEEFVSLATGFYEEALSVGVLS